MTTVDPAIFKAYDVRAIHPWQINGEVARRVGRAFVDYLGGAPKRIAVGRDVRLSSPEIAGGFIEGARSEGAEITDIGVVGTDMMYFYVASQDLDGGAIITASHNPKEYNGIKMVRRGALALSGDAGIKEIKEAIMAGRFADKGTKEGKVVARTISDEYADHCLGFIDVAKVPRIKAVRDRVQAAGGVALMNRVGHAFIKKRMRDENAVFGGEVSGHFYFRDNWYADNGMIPALLVLELLGLEGRKMSELLAPLRSEYFITGEINSKVADAAAALRRLEERYGDAQITKMDGVSMDYPDWHFNVRLSNTEPLLRLNLEAFSREDMV